MYKAPIRAQSINAYYYYTLLIKHCIDHRTIDLKLLMIFLKNLSYQRKALLQK